MCAHDGKVYWTDRQTDRQCTCLWYKQLRSDKHTNKSNNHRTVQALPRQVHAPKNDHYVTHVSISVCLPALSRAVQFLEPVQRRTMAGALLVLSMIVTALSERSVPARVPIGKCCN